MVVKSEILVVSGLPRSGTSLMMAMLEQSGIPILTDSLRMADTDNPRGYYELERIKHMKRDPAWLAEARGKAMKVVSSLLYDLPTSERYRVIFMQRDLDEVLQSQEKMLLRRGQLMAPLEKLRTSFTIHIERLLEWVPRQPHLECLIVNYNELMGNAVSVVSQLVTFLDQPVNTGNMLAAIDPELYRNRRSTQVS